MQRTYIEATHLLNNKDQALKGAERISFPHVRKIVGKTHIHYSKGTSVSAFILNAAMGFLSPKNHAQIKPGVCTNKKLIKQLFLVMGKSLHFSSFPTFDFKL